MATLADLPVDAVGPFFERVQRIAVAVQEGLAADGSFVAMNNVVSQSVPHLHVHVVPRRRKDGLRGFFWPRVRYADDAEMADYASRIRDAAQVTIRIGRPSSSTLPSPRVRCSPRAKRSADQSTA